MTRQYTSVRFVLVVACLMGSLLWPAVVDAACTGSSPTWTTTVDEASVTTCVGSAIDGDTINISAGSATWSSVLTITNKLLTIVGAGIDVTTITDGMSKADFNHSFFLDYVTKAGGITRITGMTFQGGTTADSSNAGMVRIEGVSPYVRLDHLHVVTTTTGTASGIHFHGYTRGLIDHCTFDIAAGTFGMSLHSETWAGGTNFGDNSWAAPSDLGSIDKIIVEQNTFNGLALTGATKWAFAKDGYDGSRVVGRFNTFNDTSWENHGTETPARSRGEATLEVYNNTFVWANMVWPYNINARSGVARIFNNTTTTSGVTASNNDPTSVADLANFRASDHSGRSYGPWGWAGQLSVDSITRSGTTATVTMAAGTGLASYDCGTPGSCSVTISGAVQSAYNGTVAVTYISATQYSYTVAGAPASPATGTILQTMPWDQNSSSDGYATLDQPSFSNGTLISGTTPTPVGWPAEVSDPAYAWGNTINASASALIVAPGGATTTLQANRDFYNVTTGTSLPGSCTPTTGFWKTNEGSWNANLSANTSGVLYTCTSTNTWTRTYTPFCYPHPLQSGGLTCPQGTAGLLATHADQ